MRERLKAINSRTLFFLGLILAASGVLSPPVALALGLCYGLTFVHSLRADSSNLAKSLLQLSVVALGFGMDLFQVIRVGSSGFLYTAVGIAASLTLGLLLGRMLRVDSKASLLIAVGTAICGGSAIAAVAPVVEASEDEISVAMGTVFILNSVALFAFPPIGRTLHLSQSQFGLWAALAIHDTSSVVGASAKYGAQALTIGTTVKLARALWIIPVALLFASIYRSRDGAEVGGRRRVKLPWFILFFCIASVIRTFTPSLKPLCDTIAHLGKSGLTAVLFLIGAGISRQSIKQVGYQPLLQGIVLWIAISIVSVLAIFRCYIALN